MSDRLGPRVRWVRRIAIVGNSGAGKSTLARALSAALGVEHLELDGLNHQPGWTALPLDQLRARVDAVTAGDGWVVDGNYAAVRDLVWGRADTLVWLDLPRRVVFPRVLRRTIARGVLRRELWNGNRESLRNLLSRDPEVNVVLWSWTRHGPSRERTATDVADPAYRHLDVVRLRSRGEVRRFLDTLR